MFRSAVIALSAAGFLAALLLVPAEGVASDMAKRLTGDTGQVARPADGAQDSQPFDGVPAVGTLFTEKAGKLHKHFCTASVVHAAAGDLAVTAAHCYAEISGATVFIPGYHDGVAPYGSWRVTKVYTDESWQSTQDQDDDVAFLRLAPSSDGVPIEDVTGAERIGTGSPGHTYVQVIGYPDSADKPVWCANWAESYTATQQEFDCGDYTTGTSGAPFLADVSGVTGEGTIIGVIGGYQQGGLTASVSYSIAFGSEVATLYRTATTGN